MSTNNKQNPNVYPIITQEISILNGSPKIKQKLNNIDYIAMEMGARISGVLLVCFFLHWSFRKLKGQFTPKLIFDLF